MSTSSKKSNVDLLVQGAILGATVATVVVGGALIGLSMYRNNTDKNGQDVIDGWIGYIAEHVSALAWENAIVPLGQLISAQTETE